MYPCMFLCAPILRESNNHVSFKEPPYQEWYKVNEGEVVLYSSPRACMQAIECHFQQYGIYGLRLGSACPATATAFGILDRIIMHHIGWKLESSKNRHIQESVN